MGSMYKFICCLLLFFTINTLYAQTYQSADNGRDGLVVTYDISYSFEKQSQSYLAIRLTATPKSIHKITYLGKVYNPADLPADIIKNFLAGATRPNVHFDLYNGGSLLTNWSSREHLFTILWSRVFSHQSTGDYKTNDAAIQKLNKQGHAMVDAGGLRIQVTAIDNVLFNTMLLDDFLRKKREGEKQKAVSPAGNETGSTANSNAQTGTATPSGAADAGDDFWNDKPKQQTGVSTSDQKKAADEKAVDELMTGIQKDQEASSQVYKDIDRRADLQRQGFAAVGAREEARNNVKQLSTLSGSYQSVDQLMADFNARMAQLNSAVSDLTIKKNQALNSSADAFFNTPDVAAYGEGIKAVGAMLNGAKEAKERKKAQEELRQQKEYMLNTMLAEEKRLLTGIRTDLFARFKEGALPLSSTKLASATIYYFVYAYDASQLSAKNPAMFVSNVFPVGRYSDGTWPFKTTIMNDITKLTPYAEVLHGYYPSADEAAAMQAALMDVFTRSGGSVTKIAYKGKNTSGAATATSTDFWETGKKATEPASQEKKPVKKDDFWNN